MCLNPCVLPAALLPPPKALCCLPHVQNKTPKHPLLNLNLNLSPSLEHRQDSWSESWESFCACLPPSPLLASLTQAKHHLDSNSSSIILVLIRMFFISRSSYWWASKQHCTCSAFVPFHRKGLTKFLSDHAENSTPIPFTNHTAFRISCEIFMAYSPRLVPG